MQSRPWGWDSPATIGLLAASAVLLPLTVWWELRQREPLVQLRLFGNRNFCADNLVLAGVQFALTGVAVFGAIWVQNVLGFSAIEAGLSLLPLTLPVLIIAPARRGALRPHRPARARHDRLRCWSPLALLWVALVLHHRDYGWLVPGYVLMGIGLGVMMTPGQHRRDERRAPEMRSQASGVLQTVRQVGATLGVAVMGTVVARTEHREIAQNGASPDALHDAIERRRTSTPTGSPQQDDARRRDRRRRPRAHARRGGRSGRRGEASERERLGDQLVRAAPRGVVVRDRHDHQLVGAVLGGDLLEPRAHRLGRADDDAAAAADRHAVVPSRNASAFSTGGTAISRPRRSSVIAIRALEASRSRLLVASRRRSPTRHTDDLGLRAAPRRLEALAVERARSRRRPG